MPSKLSWDMLCQHRILKQQKFIGEFFMKAVLYCSSCREDGVEDEEWKARRIEVEKQAQEARMLKKRKRAENEAKNRAEVTFSHCWAHGLQRWTSQITRKNIWAFLHSFMS